MAYNPYCYAPQWYPAHVHYYSRGDSDNDCDDRNRGESGGASYHKPMAAGGCFRGGRGGGAARCAWTSSALTDQWNGLLRNERLNVECSSRVKCCSLSPQLANEVARNRRSYQLSKEISLGMRLAAVQAQRM
jgi:hypothetical protein